MSQVYLTDVPVGVIYSFVELVSELLDNYNIHMWYKKLYKYFQRNGKYFVESAIIKFNESYKKYLQLKDKGFNFDNPKETDEYVEWELFDSNFTLY